MKALFLRRTRPLPAQGQPAWAPALTAGVVWLLLAVSAGHWGLRWWGRSAPVAMPTLPMAERGIDTAQVAAALGSRPGAAVATPVAAAPALGSRLRLLGVVAERAGQGAALMAVDGQPPKPYRVGATVVDGLVLRSLGPRHAELSGDAGRVRLELPVTPVASPAPANPPAFIRP